MRFLLPTLVLAVAAGTATLPVHARPADSGADPRCRLPAASGPALLGERDSQLERMQQLPRGCLQDMFLQCSDAARSSLLDFGSAAVCSLGYEALLHGHFDGDFAALMSWWEDERDRPVLR